MGSSAGSCLTAWIPRFLDGSVGYRCIVATKKKAVYNNPFPTWVEIRLTEGQKSALVKDGDFKARIMSALDLITADKLKVSGKWDEKTNSAMCVLESADYDPDVSQVKYVLRSSSLSGAFLKMLYYYAVVSDRVLPDARSREAIENDDDLW